VARTGAEKRSKGFSCWDQFVAMCFCQLAQAKSLREITQGLASCEGRLRHLGLTESPARSTLSYANQVRPAALYEEVFQQVLARCHATSPGAQVPVQKQAAEPGLHRAGVVREHVRLGAVPADQGGR
jgi:hypothetical protein